MMSNFSNELLSHIAKLEKANKVLFDALRELKVGQNSYMYNDEALGVLDEALKQASKIMESKKS